MKLFLTSITIISLIFNLGCKKPTPSASATNPSDSSSSGGNVSNAFTQGSVEINVTWANPYPNSSSCLQAFSGTIGLGYNSIDITNEAFFYQVSNTLGVSLSKSALKEGVYYYKVKKKWNGSCGDLKPGIIALTEKNGTFAIVALKRTVINISL